MYLPDVNMFISSYMVVQRDWLAQPPVERVAISFLSAFNSHFAKITQ